MVRYAKDEKYLHDFVLLIALKIYLNRENWKGDYIPYKEIKIIANKYKIDLTIWNLKSSSFLNRDEVGNFTFVHRSILEFMFSKNVLLMNPQAIQFPRYQWDEQVTQFVSEGLRQKLWYIPYLFVRINNAILRIQTNQNKNYHCSHHYLYALSHCSHRFSSLSYL